jgi:hypothetical protein
MAKRVNLSDRKAMKRLEDRLPDGWVMGPTQCPINISAPMFCSAGYCVACQWLRAHWNEKPEISLGRKRPTPALSAEGDER